jgi:transposase
MTQLLQNSNGKGIILILDNASCHKSRKVKIWLERHKNVRLFYLPPYSPEYNPVEQVWKWIKTNLYSVYASLSGADELKQRFRRLCWRWLNGWPAHTFSPGMGVWSNLL